MNLRENLVEHLKDQVRYKVEEKLKFYEDAVKNFSAIYEENENKEKD